jgi:hypothetical protein
LDGTQTRALFQKFVQIFFLCAEAIALTKFTDLEEMTHSLFPCSLADKFSQQNAQYTSSFFVTQAVQSMAAILLEGMTSAIVVAPVYSILFDECDDVSNNKILSVFARFVGATDKTVHVVFLGLTTMKSGTGEAVFEGVRAIMKRFEAGGLCIRKAVGVGADGCSTILNEKVARATANNAQLNEHDKAAALKSLAATLRLLRLNSLLVIAHCSCHKLALAAFHAASLCPFLANEFTPSI